MSMIRTRTFGRSAEAHPQAVSLADTPVRMAFLRKVYSLFTFAMILFSGVTYWASSSEWAFNLVAQMGFIGLIVLLAGVFFLARVTASRFPLNLIGLGAFAAVYGFLAGPQVAMALEVGGPQVVLQAAVLTSVVFLGLTSYVLLTKKDFSWMRGALWAGFALMFGIAILSMFGIGGSIVAGMGWSIAWVLLMAGFMLYDTSNILHRYPADQAASAALTIFLDFVIMFLHILRLLSRRD